MPAKRKKSPRKAVSNKTPRTRKPDNMSVEEWQTALRREFGREQDFAVRNLGLEPLFSEYAVTNPKSMRAYRVAIRGKEPGSNFCSCPDFSKAHGMDGTYGSNGMANPRRMLLII